MNDVRVLKPSSKKKRGAELVPLVVTRAGWVLFQPVLCLATKHKTALSSAVLKARVTWCSVAPLRQRRAFSRAASWHRPRFGPTLSRSSRVSNAAPNILEGAVSLERNQTGDDGGKGMHLGPASGTGASSSASGSTAPTKTAPETTRDISPIQGVLHTESQSQTAPFMKWVCESGIEIAGLAIKYFGSEHLRGIVAETTLPARSILARIPGSLTLQTRSDDGARGCPLPPAICAPEFWRSAPWWGRLSLLLLFERYKFDPESAEKLEKLVLHRRLRRWERRPNQRSRFPGAAKSALTLSPWFQLLPTSFTDRPLHWTAAERRELQYACLERAIVEQERKWRDLYVLFVERTFTRRGISLESLGGLFSEHDFYWALNVVVTRAFSGPCETTPFRERWRQTCFAGALSLASWNTHLLDTTSALNVFLVVTLSQLVFDALYPRIYRSLHGNPLKKYVIAPLIDLFNHSSKVTSAVSYEYFYDAFLLSVVDREFVAGEQVFISYGNLTNDELLAVYGFVEDDNPHDTYKLWDPRSETMIILDATGTVRNQTSAPNLSNAALGELIRVELASMPTTLIEDEHMKTSTRQMELARRFRMGKKRILERALKRVDAAGVSEQVDASVHDTRA